MAQLEAIRHEIRSISLMNPGPMTRKLMDNAPEPSLHVNAGNLRLQKILLMFVLTTFIVSYIHILT